MTPGWGGGIHPAAGWGAGAGPGPASPHPGEDQPGPAFQGGAASHPEAGVAWAGSAPGSVVWASGRRPASGAVQLSGPCGADEGGAHWPESVPGSSELKGGVGVLMASFRSRP
jgi:hypothetical protein